MKLIKIMKFETAVRIHFFSDVFSLMQSRNLAAMATWHNDLSSLFHIIHVQDMDCIQQYTYPDYTQGKSIKSSLFRQNSISRSFQEAFSTADAMLFLQNTYKIGKNAVEMSQASLDIAGFERFTDVNLFKYAFNVIQKWETDFIWLCFFFVSSYGRRRWK